MLIIYALICSLAGTALLVYFTEYATNGSILGWTIPLYLVGLFIAAILVFLIFLFILTLFVDRKKTYLKPKRLIGFFTFVASQFVMAFYRLNIKTIGKENLPEDGKFLLVCNHQSILDPMIIISQFPKADLTFIMKEEVMKIPVVGRWLYGAGFLPLNRNNNRQGAETVIKAVKRIDIGSPVCVFPEGTRSKDTKVGELKNGIFKTALRAECGVVVVTIDNSFVVRHRFPLKGTKIILKIEEFIPYEEIKDLHATEIGNRVKKIMEDNIEDFRNEYSWIGQK